MPITKEQLDDWKNLPSPVPELIAEVQRQRDLLRFIWWAAFTATQTAWGPLDDVRRTILHEIKDATTGKLPAWFDPNAPEWFLSEK